MTPTIAKPAIPHVASVPSVIIANHHSHSAARSAQATKALRTFQEEIVCVEGETRSRQRVAITASPAN
jgi:hypothetical protein